MYQHQLIPVSRLIEHLGDKGLIDQSTTERLQATATDLSLEGYTEYVIVDALFNNSTPEVRAEITRFQETPEEHRQMNHVLLTKGELFATLGDQLDTERIEMEDAFFIFGDSAILSLSQALYHIPPHHPRAIDLVISIYLTKARDMAAQGLNPRFR